MQVFRESNANKEELNEKFCKLWKRSKLGQFSYKIASIKVYFKEKGY